MKRISVLMAGVLLLFAHSYSQESAVYVRGGLNLANVSTTNDGSIEEANTLASFQVGLLGDIPVTSFLSVQPGLFFTGKGSKTQSGSPSDASYYRATSNPSYIEVPVNLVFKAPLNKESKFFAGAGPYIAMGIGGKNKAEGKIFGIAFNSEEKIDFSNDDPTTSGDEGAGFGIMKRFDYGINGTAGFEGQRVLVSLNYGLGLAKLQSGADNTDDKNKHRVLSITVGFKL